MSQATKAQAIHRVLKPTKIAIPPRNSIAAIRYPNQVGAGAPPAIKSMKRLVPALLVIELTSMNLNRPYTMNTADNSTRLIRLTTSGMAPSLHAVPAMGRFARHHESTPGLRQCEYCFNPPC